MKKKQAASKSNFFDSFATKTASITGSSYGFLTAFALVIVWGVTGPIFHFSDSWQMVINTGTTIITFLMVFLIQKAQNKDSLAIQLKLNELLAASELASNRLVSVEDITEDELKIMKEYYCKLSSLAKKENSIHNSHSLDEADELHTDKQKRSPAGKRKSN